MRIINWRLTAIALAGAAALTLGTVSCKKQAATKPPDVDYYTCTMHPSVKSQDPNAKCPICSMDLVPVMKKRGASTQASAEAKSQGKTDEKAVGMPGEKQAESAGGEAAHEVEGMKDMEEMKGMPSIAGMQKKEMKEEEPGEFMVAASRQQQIGVTYARVSNKPLQLSVRTVGTVAFDRIRHWNIVTRVDGYVDKLFVASAGELIEKGGPVINIYSPDLLTTQREFLDLLRARDEAKSSASAAVGESLDKLIEAAKGRLRLWSITDAQIQDLERERKPNVYLTLFAPVRGLVQNIEVSQGQKAMSGDRLVTVDDLSLVWVWAEFYQEEIPLLKVGQQVKVTTSAYPDEEFQGKITVMDPFVDPATRVVRARLDIDNPEFKLRPDMYVDVALFLDLGEGLTIPVSAVIPTGNQNIVFVDKGEGKLEPRFIKLGRKFGDDYQVRSGLREGERVVASANFLIDAEAKIQGALKSF